VSLEEHVSKYIISADHVFSTMNKAETCMKLDNDRVIKVIESAKAYLDDAKYYRNKQELEVSLTSVAYCEGLLDALRMLGALNFEWPTKTSLSKKE
jgi:FAD synthetase